MNDLIKIDGERITVSGRLLHGELGIETPYTTWFARMCEYGFANGLDYTVNNKFVTNPNGGRQTQFDHELTLDMAKEIAMVQRTPTGKRVREYFIAAEKELRENQKQIKESPEALMARALIVAQDTIKRVEASNAKLAAEIKEREPLYIFGKTLADAEGNIIFREMAHRITQSGYRIGERELIELSKAHELIYSKSRMGSNSRIEYEPTQRAMNRGIFRIVKSEHNAGGKRFTTQTIKITPTGQQYFLYDFAPRYLSSNEEREKREGRGGQKSERASGGDRKG